jgi:hypothetical protein
VQRSALSSGASEVGTATRIRYVYPARGPSPARPGAPATPIGGFVQAEGNIPPRKSLAFIGSATAIKQHGAEIFTALSITRHEGSRWCLRRTRWAMEKVRACGLNYSRNETPQLRKGGGENECEESSIRFWVSLLETRAR